MIIEVRYDFERLLYHAAGGDAAQMDALRGYEVERFFMYLKNKDHGRGH